MASYTPTSTMTPAAVAKARRQPCVMLCETVRNTLSPGSEIMKAVATANDRYM